MGAAALSVGVTKWRQLALGDRGRLPRSPVFGGMFGILDVPEQAHSHDARRRKADRAEQRHTSDERLSLQAPEEGCRWSRDDAAVGAIVKQAWALLSCDSARVRSSQSNRRETGGRNRGDTSPNHARMKRPRLHQKGVK